MAKAFAQKNSGQVTAAAPAANPVVFGSNVGGAGSILVADVWWNNLNALSSIADNHGNVWTPVGSRQSGSGALAAFSMQSFVALTPAAGATTVTATPSAQVLQALLIREYSGFTGTPTITGTPIYNTPTAAPTTVDSGDVTTTIADAILLSACFPADACTNPIAGGYTSRAASDQDAQFGGGDYGDLIATSIQTNVHCTYRITSASINIVVNFAVGDAPGGGVGATITGAGGIASPKRIVPLPMLRDKLVIPKPQIFVPRRRILVPA